MPDRWLDIETYWNWFQREAQGSKTFDSAHQEKRSISGSLACHNGRKSILVFLLLELINFNVKSFFSLSKWYIKKKIFLIAVWTVMPNKLSTFICVQLLALYFVLQFCNEFSVPKDKLEHFKDITPQDIVCSQVPNRSHTNISFPQEVQTLSQKNNFITRKLDALH